MATLKLTDLEAAILSNLLSMAASDPGDIDFGILVSINNKMYHAIEPRRVQIDEALLAYNESIKDDLV